MARKSRWIVAASIAVSTVAPLTALAQQPTDGPSPNTCEKPGDFAPIDKQGSQATKFAKKLDEYKACIATYSKTNGAKADALAAQSRAYADASNGAIDDYNQYVNSLNARNKSNDTGNGAARVQ